MTSLCQTLPTPQTGMAGFWTKAFLGHSGQKRKTSWPYHRQSLTISSMMSLTKTKKWKTTRNVSCWMAWMTHKTSVQKTLMKNRISKQYFTNLWRIQISFSQLYTWQWGWFFSYLLCFLLHYVICIAWMSVYATFSKWKQPMEWLYTAEYLRIVKHTSFCHTNANQWFSGCQNEASARF